MENPYEKLKAFLPDTIDFTKGEREFAEDVREWLVNQLQRISSKNVIAMCISLLELNLNHELEVLARVPEFDDVGGVLRILEMLNGGKVELRGPDVDPTDATGSLSRYFRSRVSPSGALDLGVDIRDEDAYDHAYNEKVELPMKRLVARLEVLRDVFYKLFGFDL
jgi:hypothetical protein